MSKGLVVSIFASLNVSDTLKDTTKLFSIDGIAVRKNANEGIAVGIGDANNCGGGIKVGC